MLTRIVRPSPALDTFLQPLIPLLSLPQRQHLLEMADALLYLVRLADKLNVDLIGAASSKIALNAQKYPADKARGSNRKYTEL